MGWGRQAGASVNKHRTETGARTGGWGLRAEGWGLRLPGDGYGPNVWVWSWCKSWEKRKPNYSAQKSRAYTEFLEAIQWQNSSGELLPWILPAGSISRIGNQIAEQVASSMTILEGSRRFQKVLGGPGEWWFDKKVLSDVGWLSNIFDV
jgi:hypothetical protein